VYRLYIEIFQHDPGSTMKWALEGRHRDVAHISPDQVSGAEEAEAEAIFGPGLTQGINALPRVMRKLWIAALGASRAGAGTRGALNSIPSTRLRFLDQVATPSIERDGP